MMKIQLIKNWWLFNNNYVSVIIIAWVLFCPCYFFAQNIVPNGSFEDFSICPTSTSQLSYSENWFEPFFCSSDYYNICNNNFVGIPNNYVGFQYPKTGNSYVGIVVFNTLGANSKEFIQVTLASSLEQGKNYCVNFFISATQKDSYAVNYAINTIGCLFTTDTFLLDSCNQQIALEPQIENIQGIITDTMNWVLISGEFIASGGEQFLTIGNFRNDSNTSVLLIDSTAPNSYYAYYYIDDVSVTLCDTTAVEELKIEDYRLQIYPNPASNNVTVTAEGGDEIRIFDVAGREIKRMKNFQSSLSFSIDEIENGIYFISVLKNNRIVTTEKLVVIH